MPRSFRQAQRDGRVAHLPMTEVERATAAYPTWSSAIQSAAAQFFMEIGGRTAREAR